MFCLKMQRFLGNFLSDRKSALLNDIDNDDKPDLAIGARFDSDNASQAGALWIVEIDVCDPPVSCRPDIAENDGVVDTFDLLLLLQNWGGDGPGANLAAPNDLVDTFDLLELLQAWGDC